VSGKRQEEIKKIAAKLQNITCKKSPHFSVEQTERESVLELGDVN
jgi:hypothetical protein